MGLKDVHVQSGYCHALGGRCRVPALDRADDAWAVSWATAEQQMGSSHHQTAFWGGRGGRARRLGLFFLPSPHLAHLHQGPRTLLSMNVVSVWERKEHFLGPPPLLSVPTPPKQEEVGLASQGGKSGDLVSRPPRPAVTHRKPSPKPWESISQVGRRRPRAGRDSWATREQGCPNASQALRSRRGGPTSQSAH